MDGAGLSLVPIYRRLNMRLEKKAHTFLKKFASLVLAIIIIIIIIIIINKKYQNVILQILQFRRSNCGKVIQYIQVHKSLQA